MKKLFYGMIVTMIYLSQTVVAQELGDVEVVTRKLESVKRTKYGYVVEYPSSNLYGDLLFIPRDWFLNKKERTIIADQRTMYLNVSVPMIKVIYIDRKLRYLTLFVPKSYSQTIFPKYEGPMEDDQLKYKFEKQKELNTLILK